MGIFHKRGYSILVAKWDAAPSKDQRWCYHGIEWDTHTHTHIHIHIHIHIHTHIHIHLHAI